MKKIYFNWQSGQPTGREPLFAFHENPANLREVQPPGLHIVRLEAKARAAVGEDFHLVVRQCGVEMDWKGRWLEVEEPVLLVDGQVKGPLAYFRHRHCFLPDPEGRQGRSLLRDELELELPRVLAWPGGRFAFAAFVGRDFLVPAPGDAGLFLSAGQRVIGGRKQAIACDFHFAFHAEDFQ